jgi:hypothetical protein
MAIRLTGEATPDEEKDDRGDEGEHDLGVAHG